MKRVVLNQRENLFAMALGVCAISVGVCSCASRTGMEVPAAPVAGTSEAEPSVSDSVVVMNARCLRLYLPPGREGGAVIEAGDSLSDSDFVEVRVAVGSEYLGGIPHEALLGPFDDHVRMNLFVSDSSWRSIYIKDPVIAARFDARSVGLIASEIWRYRAPAALEPDNHWIDIVVPAVAVDAAHVFFGCERFRGSSMKLMRDPISL